MFKGKKIYTIIPARGGSKSLPRKNIRVLKGKPLVVHSIEYSLKCKIVDRTIVSTDNQEIARISKNHGAEVPFLRPSKYAQDTTQDFPVFQHVANWIQKHEGHVPDFFVLLRPTSPVRPNGLIEAGIKLLLKNPKADSVRSVALCSEHPYRMWDIQEDYMYPIIKKNIKEPYNIPRQKLSKIYYQTGDIEIMRSSTILNKHSVSGDLIMPLVLNKEEMLDIDTLNDLRKAESKLKK